MKRVEQSETETFQPVGNKFKVGLDLGTAYIVIVVLDEENNPIACEKQAHNFLKDGVVVDYSGTLRVVKELKKKLEDRISEKTGKEVELIDCAIAMPAGTESSVKTHQYVAEGAGFEVVAVLDEPSAANAVYQISDGVIVDIGGGTTGLAILKDGKVVDIQDEPTGGTHLSLVLAGNYHISFDEAEVIKQDYSKHREILPILKPVVEKMASIIKKYVNLSETDTIYLCGGTCCLTGMEKIIEKETGIKTVKPENLLECRHPRAFFQRRKRLFIQHIPANVSLGNLHLAVHIKTMEFHAVLLFLQGKRSDIIHQISCIHHFHAHFLPPNSSLNAAAPSSPVST